MHSRHDYIRETGKRISRGAWERMNKAYLAWPQKSGRVIGYDEAGKPVIRRNVTITLHPMTPRWNRKVLLDPRRTGAHNCRMRYHDTDKAAPFK